MKKALYFSAAAVMMLIIAMPPVSAKTTTVRHSVEAVQDVNYQEIAVANVPETITEALSKDYSGYTIDKAYLGDDGSYKLDVSQASVKYSIFYKENGELIKVEEPTGKKLEENLREGTEDVREKAKEGTEDVKEGVEDLNKDLHDTIPELK